MSENELNGQSGMQSDPSPQPGPRVRPPEGLRMARGEYREESEDLVPTEAPELEVDVYAEPSVRSVEYLRTGNIEEEYQEPDFPVVEPLAADGSSVNGNGHYKPYLDPSTPRDKELGLFEHLIELRMRLLYCFIALGVGMGITWNMGVPLQEWFARPIVNVLKSAQTAGGEQNVLIVRDPAGAFAAYFVFSMIAGLILVMPFILFQIWRFIEPALTNNERKYTLVLVPFSTILFAMGATLGYYCSPLFFKFFLMWTPQGVAANWDYVASITLMAKMLLIFGISFQVPIIVIFLNKLGLVTRNLLIEYWRHAVVVIFVVIAVLTPTWDPMTLIACAVPPCVLYALSIWLVKWL